MAERPTGRPVRVKPDSVCEILSPSTASRDQIKKQRTYHRAEVPHFWAVDPTEQTLLVYRWQAEGYLLVLGAERHETVRAEPFEAIEIAMSSLFGEDDPR